jgi:chromate transport protein ChrA
MWSGHINQLSRFTRFTNFEEENLRSITSCWHHHRHQISTSITQQLTLTTHHSSPLTTTMAMEDKPETPLASEEVRETSDALEKGSENQPDGVGATAHITSNEDSDEFNANPEDGAVVLKEKSAAELLEEDIPWRTRFVQVVKTYAPLGLVAFGGPQAHVAILRDHLVVQRKWLDEEQFTELFAIGQGLPGPTSTQLVVSTALARAGPIGGITAFMLWNLPGLIVLITCGVLIATFVDPYNPPWYLVGLPPAAISLVFKAFYGFGVKLDKLGVILCLISALVSVLINGDERITPSVSQFVYPSMLVLGGITSYIDSRRKEPYGTCKCIDCGQTRHILGSTKHVGAL